MAIRVSDFFEPLVLKAPPSENDYANARLFVQAAEAFARTTNQCVYIIDYYKQGFLYVSNHPLFLCGKKPEIVLKQGYQFYFQNVPECDLELLLRINEAGFAFYKNIPPPERLQYSITYDFHLVQSTKRHLLINHQLTPLALDGTANIWLALCVVTLSSHRKAGNIVISKKNSDSVYHFNLEASEWQVGKRPVLTRQEKDVLAYSMQGFTMQEIAEKLHVSVATAKFHRKNILQKFNVSNISEAVAYAANYPTF